MFIIRCIHSSDYNTFMAVFTLHFKIMPAGPHCAVCASCIITPIIYSISFQDHANSTMWYSKAVWNVPMWFSTWLCQLCCARLTPGLWLCATHCRIALCITDICTRIVPYICYSKTMLNINIITIPGLCYLYWCKGELRIPIMFYFYKENMPKASISIVTEYNNTHS